MTSVSLATRLTITLCFMALLMAVSIIPGHTQSDDSILLRLVAKTPKLLQKVLHFLLYGVLTMLSVWTLDGILSESYLLVIAFTVAVLYGAAMEWYQTKVPGRFGTFLDIALNTAGAVFGLFAAILFL